MLDKGNIWMSGEEWANLDAKGVREGSVVEIEVDRIHGKVKWFKQAGIQAYMEVMGGGRFARIPRIQKSILFRYYV